MRAFPLTGGVNLIRVPRWNHEAGPFPAYRDVAAARWLLVIPAALGCEGGEVRRSFVGPFYLKRAIRWAYRDMEPV